MNRRQLASLACCLAVLWMAMSALAQPRAASEESIKAGYLLLFSRYVEWPAGAFATARSPIVICILGQDPFGAVLEQTVAGQHSQKRALSVRRVGDVADADACHIAYIGAAEADNQKQWLAALAGKPMLTVSEEDGAASHESVLSFVTDQRGGQARIRFEASIPAMQRAGLKISAQMLVAARTVHRGAGV